MCTVVKMISNDVCWFVTTWVPCAGTPRLQELFACIIASIVISTLWQLDVNYQVDNSMLLEKSKYSILVLRSCCLNGLQKYLCCDHLLNALANHLRLTIAAS